MQFNIIFKTTFKYIHKIFRFMHTNTFCKYRKKLLASPRVHLVLYIESLEGVDRRFVQVCRLWKYLWNAVLADLLSQLILKSA